MSEQTPVDQNGPLWRAWMDYKGTEDYANTRRWALHEAHVDGSLWAAFAQGFVEALARGAAPAGAQEPTLMQRAIADRDLRPWRYYRLDYDDLRKALDAAERRIQELEAERDAARERADHWSQLIQQDAERELAEARAREQRLREQLLLVLDTVLACETRHDERGHAYLAVPARSLHDPAAEMAALREALRPTGGEAGGGERR